MSREMVQLAELLTKHQIEIYKRDKRIAELERDIGFLQSCVNSGETATISDRPSEQAKQLKGAIK